MSATMHINLPASPSCSYRIWIEHGLLSNAQKWFPSQFASYCVVIVTDDTVKPLYASMLLNALNEIGLNPLLFSFPAGEASKCQRVKGQLEEALFRQRCTRQTLILALGGGVVGDLAGFLAATYMRGIPYIQIPTTLLAMVDSSIGGKTGIDTVFGKNLIGAYWQPIAVIADLLCLDSLPQIHFINGLIEAIKMFLTHDKKQFQTIEEQITHVLNRATDSIKNTIFQAISIKAHVVQADEKESHQRATLNFGHTIGHALEQLSQYEMLHGLAVGLGILVEAKIAQDLGYLNKIDFERILSLFKTLGIHPMTLKKFDVDDVIQSTKLDKKSTLNEVRYVLLNTVGEVLVLPQQYTHPVSDALVKKAYLTVSEIV